MEKVEITIAIDKELALTINAGEGKETPVQELTQVDQGTEHLVPEENPNFGEQIEADRSDRAGKKMMPFWVRREARTQLRIMAAKMQTTQQELMRDALNDFFRKEGKPPIA